MAEQGAQKKEPRRDQRQGSPVAAGQGNHKGKYTTKARPDKPPAPVIDFDSIPAELKARRQWCLWRWEWVVDKKGVGKWDKPPYQTNSYGAKSNDPSTWTTFDAAKSALKKFDGLGIMFADGLAGIDLDHYLDHQGQLAPFARSIADRINTYGERSPSGDGVHFLFLGELPPAGRRNAKLNAEMYDHSSPRYFTITGQHLPGTPITIEQRTAEAAQIHAELFPPKVKAAAAGPATPSTLDDLTLIDMAKRAKNGAKFTLLWNGATTGYGSQSEAELALCNMLAFWTGGDAGRVNSLFRSSGLMREKWDEPRGPDGTYGQKTIAKALDLTREYYSPDHRTDSTPAAAGAEQTAEPAQPRKRRAKVTSADLAEFFAEHGYSFSENELTGVIHINGRPLVDADEAQWRNHLRDAGLGSSITHARDVMLSLATDGRFNPVKDWIEREKWDELDHIGFMAGFVTDRDGIFPLLLEHWLLGAIGRVYQPGSQNRMLVLVGPQGLGKSHIAATLALDLDTRYFLEDAIRPDDKDSQIGLASVFIWEVSELGATTRRADREALKAFITKARVNVRRPYDRYPVDAPAITSFIGTLNNDQAGFLADPTGERRFAVCDMSAIDWAYSQQVNIPQLWAQAKALYDEGARAAFNADELAQVNAVNARFYSETVGQGGLDLMLELAEGEFTATIDIVASMKFKNYSGNDNQLAKDVGDYMARRITAGDPITKVRKRVVRKKTPTQQESTYQLSGWEGIKLR